MADSLPVEKLYEWRAYHQLIGTDAWRQASTISWRVSELTAAYLAGKGVKTERPQPDDDIPLLRDRKEREQQQQAQVDQKLNAFERALTQHFTEVMQCQASSAR